MEKTPNSQVNIFYNSSLPRPTYLYEDKECIVFEEEFHPQAPIHFLVVPKKLLVNFNTASVEDEKILGHLLLTAKKIAKEKGLQETGYHIMIDEDFNSLRFKCLHVFGRALHHMIWPIGPGSRL